MGSGPQPEEGKQPLPSLQNPPHGATSSGAPLHLNISLLPLVALRAPLAGGCGGRCLGCQECSPLLSPGEHGGKLGNSGTG